MNVGRLRIRYKSQIPGCFVSILRLCPFPRKENTVYVPEHAAREQDATLSMLFQLNLRSN